MTDDCCGSTIYWCPVVGEFECPAHGGHTTCCERPQHHTSLDQFEAQAKALSKWWKEQRALDESVEGPAVSSVPTTEYPDGMSTRDVIVENLAGGRLVLREDAELLVDAAIREAEEPMLSDDEIRARWPATFAAAIQNATEGGPHESDGQGRSALVPPDTSPGAPGPGTPGAPSRWDQMFVAERRAAIDSALNDLEGTGFDASGIRRSVLGAHPGKDPE